MKEFAYLKGFAMGKNLEQTLKALTIAKKFHFGQYRKSGEPYILHPVRVALELLSLGIVDDTILAASILHDLFEDCKEELAGIDLMDEYELSQEVMTLARLLTKRSGMPTSEYYDNISGNPKASIIKISDRCHNVSTMAGVFTEEKILEYIDETKNYVIPLCKKIKDFHPVYADIVCVMQYHILSVIGAIEATMAVYKK